MTFWFILGLLAGLLLGAAGLFTVSRLSGRRLTESARREADDLLQQSRRRAENEARDIELDARQKAFGLKEQAEELHQQAERSVAEAQQTNARAERELAARELQVERRQNELDRQADDLRQREERADAENIRLINLQGELDERDRELAKELRDTKKQLERISHLNEQQARDLFLERVEAECREEAGDIIRRTLEAAEDEAKQRARTIVLEAIQRYAAEQTAEHTVSTIHLADDAMKGRVIGREGRNIRSFEKATGVDVIIDDTPGVVGISCFDPVRREVARQSLDKLIVDGRIHPGRIEEIVNECNDEMSEKLVELGSEAAHNGHAVDVPKQLLPLLGRLHFRTSFGQNVLKHSLEVAHLAQVMADELGLDGAMARRSGLLHDIGKALDHENEGPHTEIGANLLKKLGEPEAVVNAAAAHHGDVPATTPYTPLVMAADAISAGRPGARRESLERYVKRLKDLEKLAGDFRGVRKAYAIHAGREIRVIADAKALDDAQSAKLARDIAKAIKDEMTFPGEVKITVLREVRSVEVAR